MSKDPKRPFQYEPVDLDDIVATTLQKQLGALEERLMGKLDEILAVLRGRRT